jgi:hypothetical protein
MTLICPKERFTFKFWGSLELLMMFFKKDYTQQLHDEWIWIRIIRHFANTYAGPNGAVMVFGNLDFVTTWGYLAAQWGWVETPYPRTGSNFKLSLTDITHKGAEVIGGPISKVETTGAFTPFEPEPKSYHSCERLISSLVAILYIKLRFLVPPSTPVRILYSLSRLCHLTIWLLSIKTCLVAWNLWVRLSSWLITYKNGAVSRLFHSLVSRLRRNNSDTSSFIKERDNRMKSPLVGPSSLSTQLNFSGMYIMQSIKLVART